MIPAILILIFIKMLLQLMLHLSQFWYNAIIPAQGLVVENCMNPYAEASLFFLQTVAPHLLILLPVR